MQEKNNKELLTILLMYNKEYPIQSGNFASISSPKKAARTGREREEGPQASSWLVLCQP